MAESIDASPAVETVREFVLAGHGNLDKVRQMLVERPALLNMAFAWRPNDLETALQAAAHMGNRPLAEYLLSAGSPQDICTAAMLGRLAEVERLLVADPGLAQAVGAHGIGLLAHAALSGEVELVRRLVEHGAKGSMGQALNNAVIKQHGALVAWLLDNGQPDLAWTDFQGKTALQNATENGSPEIAALIKRHMTR